VPTIIESSCHELAQVSHGPVKSHEGGAGKAGATDRNPLCRRHSAQDLRQGAVAETSAEDEPEPELCRKPPRIGKALSRCRALAGGEIDDSTGVELDPCESGRVGSLHGIELRDHYCRGGDSPLAKRSDKGCKPGRQGSGIERPGRLPRFPILAPKHDAVRPHLEGEFQEALCGRHAELEAARRVACVPNVPLANRPQILAHAKADRIRSRQLAEGQRRMEFPARHACRLAEQTQKIKRQGEFAHGPY